MLTSSYRQMFPPVGIPFAPPGLHVRPVRNTICCSELISASHDVWHARGGTLGLLTSRIALISVSMTFRSSLGPLIHNPRPLLDSCANVASLPYPLRNLLRRICEPGFSDAYAVRVVWVEKLANLLFAIDTSERQFGR